MKYDQKFLDKVRIWVFGGNGGTGSCSYNRENLCSKRPAGGNGGHGGDVHLVANSRITSLHDLRRAHFKGNHGKMGLNGQRNGANGGHKTFSVPVGTEIYEVKEDLEYVKVADLDEDG